VFIAKFIQVFKFIAQQLPMSQLMEDSAGLSLIVHKFCKQSTQFFFCQRMITTSEF